MKESRYSAIVVVGGHPVSVVIAAKDENDARQKIEEKLGVGTVDSNAHVEAVWRHDPKDDPEDDSNDDEFIPPMPTIVN